jgi:hypothetical protein
MNAGISFSAAERAAQMKSQMRMKWARLYRPFRAWPLGAFNPGRRFALPWAVLRRSFRPADFTALQEIEMHLNTWTLML